MRNNVTQDIEMFVFGEPAQYTIRVYGVQRDTGSLGQIYFVRSGASSTLDRLLRGIIESTFW